MALREMVGVLAAGMAAGAFGWTPANVPGVTNGPMMTVWGERVTPANVLREYPRPQMERCGEWANLNGLWQYAVTKRTEGRPSEWKGTILVPFALESSLSGVGRLLEKDETLWYRREFAVKRLHTGYRTLLNFECVDFRAQVYVNGVEVTDMPEEGGQLPFSLDITKAVREGENELVVSVWDPTGHYPSAQGKQLDKPGGCLYTRSSGIVGTVWTEEVPATYLTGYRVVTDPKVGTISVAFEGEGNLMAATGEIEVSRGGRRVARAALEAWNRPTVIRLPSPVSLWTPEDPNLYELTLTLTDASAGTVDEVRGWVGVRSFEMKPDEDGVLRFYLNGEKRFILGALDQGWWPDGLLTPPSEEAMAADIRLLKAAGFDMMRKHIKIEPRRYYALCDKMGILVVQDMPSGFKDPQDRYMIFRKELKGMVDHLYNHPSVVMWVPFNEKWGQPDEFKTHETLMWTKRYDPTRLVDGPSGANDWEGGELWGKQYTDGRLTTAHKSAGIEEAGDTVDRHDYWLNPKMPAVNPRRASFLGEFGGCGHKVEGHVWNPSGKAFGYNTSKTRADLEKTYLKLMEHLEGLARKGLAGSVYTQASDVENEFNGLVTYDRRVVKFDLGKLAEAHERVRRAGSWKKRIAVLGGSFSVIPASAVAKSEWCRRCNLTYDDYGVGGAGFVSGGPGGTNGIPAQVDRALASGRRYDAFLLWASTNDIWGEDKIGRQNASIEACVGKIRQVSPDSKVLFLTSMPIPLQPAAGKLLLGYAEGQAETCRRLEVPVLEQHRLVEFPREETESCFCQDRLHPNEKGYSAVKDIQAEFLRRELVGD